MNIKGLTKTLGKLAQNHTVLFTIVAAAAVIYLMQNYSNDKMLGGLQGMKGSAINSASSAPVAAPTGASASIGNCGNGTNFKPSGPLGQNEQNARVNGINTNQRGMAPSCSGKATVDPSQLLPKGSNNAFAAMNPGASNDIKNVNLLKSGYHIGINTIGQSLRNSNLQIRSEPANPQMNVGPWNQTTMGPDLSRRPLEIGCK
jgi:hypothetical protein|tara:strand:- start:2864 stop:3469 length:606 start_codon:yes stop_codon:yes gene_type:complete